MFIHPCVLSSVKHKRIHLHNQLLHTMKVNCNFVCQSSKLSVFCFCIIVVDLYTCDIHFNTVRLIAVFIICLGFLMLLLPEDWDQCLIELSTKFRKREQPVEPVETAGGLNWSRRARTSMSTFSHWHTLVSRTRNWMVFGIVHPIIFRKEGSIGMAVFAMITNNIFFILPSDSGCQQW